MFVKHSVIQSGANAKKTASVSILGKGQIDTTAGKLVTINTHNNKSFDIKAEIQKHADDSVFIRALSIRADEPNQNGDFFSESELKKAVSSFVGVPLFCNHENGNVEKARGMVIASEWDDNEKAIYTISRVDSKAYPQLARGIEEGYISGVSMGCSVDYSQCSICGKKATNEKEYCEHIKNKKGKSVSGKKVYEDNFGVKFIELSFVTDPACPDCLVQEIIDPHDFLAKVANLNNILIKVASLKKEAGPDQMGWLSQAIDGVAKLIQYFIANREVIDLEFGADAMEVLDRLQSLKESLNEAGFAQSGAGEPAQPAAPQSPEQAFPEATVGEADVPPVAQEVGSVAGAPGETLAPAARLNAELKKTADLLNKFNSFERSKPLVENKKPGIVEAIRGLFVRKPKVETTVTASDENYSVLIGENTITGSKDGKEIVSWKIADLNGELKDAIASSPKEAAETLLAEIKKSASETTLTKTAEKAPTGKDQTEVITEKQLESNKIPLHPRQDEPREVITEKQLDGKNVAADGRWGEAFEVITEKQLETEKHSDKTERQDEPREVITEKQLEAANDTSPREDKPREVITEKQLEAIDIANRKNKPREVITEKQLTDQKDPLGRRAAALKLIKAAVDGLSNAAITLAYSPKAVVTASKKFIITPKAIVETAKSLMSADVKAAKEARINKVYWNKIASVIASPQETDKIILAELRNSLEAITETPELAIQALEAAVSAPNAEAMIDDAIKAKTATAETVEETVTLKDSFSDALKPEAPKTEAKKEEAIEVKAMVEEIGVKADSKDFEKSAFEFAKKVAETSGHKVSSLISVTANKDGAVAVRMALTNQPATTPVEIADEAAQLKARAEARRIAAGLEVESSDRQTKRDELVKKAQFGGAVGAMPPAGGGGGAGTTMPMGPEAAAPPMESFKAPEAGAEAPAAPELPDAADAGSEAGNPQPPGSLCPVCGSEDVDLLEGEGRCNACKAEFTMSVAIDVNRWPGTFKDEGKEGEAVQEEAKGAELPTAGLPEIPVNASLKLNPESLIRTGNKVVGSHCPSCGSDKVAIANGKGKCEKCTQDYTVDILVDKDDPKAIYASVTWLPKVHCPDCLKKSANKTNKPNGKFIFQADHENVLDKKAHFPMNNAEQAKDALARAASYKDAPKWWKGKLEDLNNEVTKIATAASNVKTATTVTPSVNSPAMPGPVRSPFPMESCRERLARRFGENAVCLSGPNEGKPLVDSVCELLAKAKTKSIGLAVKIAGKLAERDPMQECLEDQIRGGYTIKHAENICNCLKNKYAQEAELAIDDFMSKGTDIPTNLVDEMDYDAPSDDIPALPAPETTDLAAPDTEIKEDIHEDVEKDADMPIAELAEDVRQDVNMLVDKVKELVDVEKQEEAAEKPIEGNIPAGVEQKEEAILEGTPAEGETSADIPVAEEVNPEADLMMSSSRIKTERSSLRSINLDKLATQIGKPAPVDEAKDLKGEVPEDKQLLGKEDKQLTELKKPDVPEKGGKATLGHEVVIPAATPDVPAGKGKMGDEQLEGGNVETKGTVIAGKIKGPGIPDGTGPMKDSPECQMNKKEKEEKEEETKKAATKTAAEKKIEDPKPVDEAKDLKGKVPEDKQLLGKEDKQLAECAKPDVPEKGGKATLGNEPAFDAKKPSVPAGDGKLGHETLDGGNVETKGTVIAETEDAKKQLDVEKVKMARYLEASKIVAKELAAGMISLDEFESKVLDLVKMPIQGISAYAKTIEKQLQKQAASGLPAVKNDGSVEIGIVASAGSSPKEESLKDKLMKHFSLTRRFNS